MKPNLLKTAASASLAASFLMMLSACNGQSSNPLEKYKDVKGDPYTGNTPQSEKQDVVTDGKFHFDVEKKYRFIENTPGELTIRVTPKFPSIGNYEVSIVNFSLSNQPQLRAGKAAGEYILSWTPPQGSAAKSNEETGITLTLRATVLTATDARILTLTENEVIELKVIPVGSVPVILNPEKLNGIVVDEGQKIPSFIDVEDPATKTMNGVPKVFFPRYITSNTEAFVADGAKMIPDDLRVERLSETRWRFHFVVDTTNLVSNRDREGKVDPNASSLDICLYMKVLGVNNVVSPEDVRPCFKAKYFVQSPELIWEADHITEIKSGVESKLKFTIKTANDLGKTEIKDAEAQIRSLSGSKSISCSFTSMQNVNSKTCVLTWTPACSSSVKKQKVSFKVDNTLGGRTKTQRFEKEFTLLSNEEMCPAKRPKTKGGVR